MSSGTCCKTMIGSFFQRVMPIIGSVLILLILCVPASASFSSPTIPTSNYNHYDDNPIPIFSIPELQSRLRRQELKETLSSTGLLAVRLSGGDDDDDATQNYANNRQTALQGLCECHDHPEFLFMEQTRSIVLQDDATRRTSVGTATVGMNHPLPLPKDLEDICGSDTVVAMEGLRDAVADVSKAFVTALGDLIEEYSHSKVPLLQDKHGGKSYQTLSNIVESANHLEHFHVYSKESQRNEENNVDSLETAPAAWDWHTDAGLFLVFVPALNCLDGYPQDASFWYRDSYGNPVQAHFDGSNTAIVMLGQGAEDWLNLAAVPESAATSGVLRLKATVHSVRWDIPSFVPQEPSSFFQQQRSWYGMMYLVPENAMIYGTKTLKEVRSSLSWSLSSKSKMEVEDSGSTAMTLGCANSEPTFDTTEPHSWTEDDMDAVPKRRRMQHQDPSACNNVTNFFCWMQCLEIPSANQAEGYVNEGYSLYCLDPAILASSGNRVSEAAAPCEAGFVHNANCLGSWQPTAPGVPAATVNVTADATDFEQPFCYSGTTMYMDGFHFFQSTTCIIFLFQSWVLDTGGKYALAFLGTLMAGVCLEKLIQQRRKYMAMMGAGRNRLIFSAVFYGIQLTIGYMLMLVIMIYSGALFISTVMGLVLGHVFFNAKDAIWPLKTGATTLVIPGPGEGSEDGSYMVESNSDPEQTGAPVELATELTSQPAMINHEKEWATDAVQNGACCGKGYGTIATDPGDQLIPEGSTPCCQYSSAD